MRIFRSIPYLLAGAPALVLSLSSSSLSRRDLLQTFASSVLGAGVLAIAATPSFAADEASATSTPLSSELQDVYFGVGCFWHIQHEFIQAEEKLLGRNEHSFTSATGYAGGTSTGKDGKVCYHNLQMTADYGRLGHGEVVGMSLPVDKIADFTKLYFTLFNPKTLDRVDPGDQGGEYRSLLGLPGGVNHPVYPKMEAIAKEAGFKLVPGKGNDPDTFRKQTVYVYDTAKFPFYQAEIYHQYHNDFQDKPYGQAYNQLADLALEEGRLHTTGCPDRV
ncbi:hypothetical protein MPSEU_000035000 [Mayamaea pseudoterrestris]|nr:hypothetical protein MPSEU_000035000 [Mayamaea pseudoterrestris]